MRPQSIVLFERITFAAFFAGLLNSALNWDALLDRMAKASANPAPLLVLSFAFGLLVTASLTLWVSRWRSKVAMWIGIALFAFGLPLTVIPFLNGTAIGSPVIPALAALAQIYAYCLLFTPGATRWMDHEPEVSPEIFR
ncbi:MULTISPECIES: hypothetical protein [unclassified Sphingomonas]|uniref:hypothetical protein n=1 Tax=Sphingomonas TaxID=13687 RepID=UPI000964E509|nr:MULTISPECIES: hypothetical protein [unclassified Sphingomonas]MBN8812050.1 hypothetical protein [Sphingomonas sp.]OJY48309.1 MAG: hypothetical protein BGP17_00540 [Sphingomonas sp. 67-41]